MENHRWTWIGPVVIAALIVGGAWFRFSRPLPNQGQFRQAHVIYSPSGDDVSFSLTALRPQSVPVVESVCLLTDKPPAP